MPQQSDDISPSEYTHDVTATDNNLHTKSVTIRDVAKAALQHLQFLGLLLGQGESVPKQQNESLVSPTI